MKELVTEILIVMEILFVKQVEFLVIADRMWLIVDVIVQSQKKEQNTIGIVLNPNVSWLV
jgi:hypothetical protein